MSLKDLVCGLALLAYGSVDEKAKCKLLLVHVHVCIIPVCIPCYAKGCTHAVLVNPRRACAARVTVVGLCVC